jgi:hypothetical protein
MKSANPILGMQVVGLDLKWAKRHDSRPTSGLFLMFDDGTYYEFHTTKGYHRSAIRWQTRGSLIITW